MTGEGLDPKEVWKARLKEIGYINQKAVWKKIPRAEAQMRGIKVIGTRWIDVNKGDAKRPELRSRLVAQEYNMGKEDGIFAATPPLEAVKMQVDEAATMDRGQQQEENVIMVNDVRGRSLKRRCKDPCVLSCQ